jgi:hypothetical protein
VGGVCWWVPGLVIAYRAPEGTHPTLSDGDLRAPLPRVQGVQPPVLEVAPPEGKETGPTPTVHIKHKHGACTTRIYMITAEAEA